MEGCQQTVCWGKGVIGVTYLVAQIVKITNKIKKSVIKYLDIQVYFHPGLLCGSTGITGGVYSKFVNPVSSVSESQLQPLCIKMIITIIFS